MGKVRNTRKQRAAELLNRLEHGPAWHTFTLPHEMLSEHEATRQFRIWSLTWIVPVLKELVPELKEAK